MGQISDNIEKAYLEEETHLENWCQENNLSVNVSKTKELTKDQPLRINGAPVERVDSFRYLRLSLKVLKTFYACTVGVCDMQHPCLVWEQLQEGLPGPAYIICT